MDHVNDPDYGLSSDKPVFVCGAGERDWLLQHMSAEDGTALVWHKRYDAHIKDIYGEVEVWDAQKTDSKKRRYIDICGYTNVHGKIAGTVPSRI